jgi:hypothetical protein
VKITCRRCCDGGLGVGSHNTDWECCQHTPLSLALIQEKALK